MIVVVRSAIETWGKLPACLDRFRKLEAYATTIPRLVRGANNNYVSMSQSTSQSAEPSGKVQLSRLGTIHDDAVPILFHERVFDEIIEYSHQDLRNEIGGFLIGGPYEADREYVEIRDFLPANKTQSRAASLTFTHDTWSELNREVEEKFPDDKVIGWHHTHPGFGIFLSAYDLFIHRNYFSAPFHIALVVDPKAQEFGFFQWRGDEIVDCGFVFMFENPESQ